MYPFVLCASANQEIAADRHKPRRSSLHWPAAGPCGRVASYSSDLAGDLRDRRGDRRRQPQAATADSHEALAARLPAGDTKAPSMEAWQLSWHPWAILRPPAASSRRTASGAARSRGADGHSGVSVLGHRQGRESFGPINKGVFAIPMRFSLICSAIFWGEIAPSQQFCYRFCSKTVWPEKTGPKARYTPPFPMQRATARKHPV